MFQIRELSKKCKYNYELKYTDSFLKSIRKKFFYSIDDINKFKKELKKQEKNEKNILNSNNTNFKFK